MLVSQAEFARMVGVARKSVTVWKNDGRIVMVGKMVDVEASRAKLATYSSSRSKGYVGAIAMRWANGNMAEQTVTLPRLPGPVASLLTAAQCWAEDAALAMLKHLPEETVREIHAILLAQWRTDAAELSADDFTPPMGLPSWAVHPSFKDPVSVDWEELRAEALGEIGGPHVRIGD